MKDFGACPGLLALVAPCRGRHYLAKRSSAAHDTRAHMLVCTARRVLALTRRLTVAVPFTTRL